MVGCAAVPESLMTESDDPITDVQRAWRSFRSRSCKSGYSPWWCYCLYAVDDGEQKTRLEIVAMPIGSDGKPKLGSGTQQRFVAYVDGFLEPMSTTRAV